MHETRADLLGSVLKAGRLPGTIDRPGSRNTPRYESLWEPDRRPRSSPAHAHSQFHQLQHITALYNINTHEAFT